MKRLKITYWIFTILLLLLMGVGSIPNILSSEASLALFAHLGYPAYILPFIGAAKLLGAIAILLPGFPRLKEWAYAGFVIDLSGAMYSTIAVGDPVATWLTFIVGYAIIAGSYVCHHKLLKARNAG